MCPYLNMIQTVNSRFNDKVKDYCAPLFDCFNLNHFWYYKLTNEGHIVFLGAHPEWGEYFAAHKFYLKYPYLRHPKYLHEGVHLQKNVENEALSQILGSCEDRFGIRQGVQVLTKASGGIEEFGFSSGSSSDSQTSLLLSELPLLRFFFKKFREDNRLIFSHLEDYQVDMASLIGPSFYEKGMMAPPPTHKQLFLSRLGVGVQNALSPVEAEVVRFLLKGYSASQIGRHVFRSKRTIEHRIERIKEKLACHSKAELIQKARELERVGCL